MKFNRFRKTSYLVLFILLGAVGVGTAYAGILPLITLSGDVLIIGDTELEGKLLDTNDDAGTSGQLLSSTETGTDWIDAPIVTPGSIQLEDLSPELVELLGLGAPPCPNPSHLGYVMEGQVTLVSDNDNQFGGSISVGDTWNAFYCIDPNTPDLFPNNLIQGSYEIDSITATIGDYEVPCSDVKFVAIENGQSDDDYLVFCATNEPESLFNPFLRDTDATVFDDDSLPQSGPDFGEFEENSMSFNLEGNIQSSVLQATLTSFVQVQ